MKSFVKYILKILLILIISACFMDFFYTEVFNSSKERNKIQAVINSNYNNLDVMILGSSRANNHFVTEEFSKENLSAFNFGMSGSSLEESALLLKLMIEGKAKIKNVLLEVDLNVKSESSSEGTKALFMPYLREKVIASYYENSQDFKLLCYIPFYRYVIFETKIGVREMFFSLIKKKSKNIQNGGFTALKGSSVNMSYNLTKVSEIKKANKIRIFCL